jgi:F-type H+-transporting ATPase subunit b
VAGRQSYKVKMLSIDLSVIVIFVIVWVLVFVLSRVYFKPVRRIMNQRDGQIQQDRTAAQEALDKYTKTLEKIEEDIKAAKTSAREIRENWAQEAQKEKESMIDEVSRECRSQVRKANQELNENVERLKKELEPRGKEFAERIAKRLLN